MRCSPEPATSEFRSANVLEPIPGEDQFDVVYARFVLSHLPDPGALVTNLRSRLTPGGVMILEDVDSAGMFCHPPCDAYQRFVELYIAAVRQRGADPNIGPRLPGLLADAVWPMSTCASCSRPGSAAR